MTYIATSISSRFLLLKKLVSALDISSIMCRKRFFPAKLLKTMRCGFHFGPQTTFIAKLRTGVFFFLKKIRDSVFRYIQIQNVLTVGTVLRSKQLKKSLHELLVP